MNPDRLPEIISELYQLVRKLEEMFPRRHFTPDGHLVGSIGECLAAYHYGLELLPASSPGADAVKGSIRVEIKATQAGRIGIRSKPEHLLVLQLDKQGSFTEIYNGPGSKVWEEVAGKPAPSNGQYQVSLTKLRSLMELVPEEERMPMVVPQR